MAKVCERTTWLVDGFNVLQVGGLVRSDETQEGWWRREARDKLLRIVAPVASEDSPVTVVFDGPRPAPPGEDGAAMRVVFAPSADAWIAAAVRRAPAPEAVRVVTADHSLSGRCQHRGASVVSPREFLDQCRAAALE